MSERVGMMIVAGVFFGLIAIMGWGGLAYNAGEFAGRVQERADIMATPVTIGNPSNPDCSVVVTISVLAEMSEMGVYGWAAACEEATQ